MQGQKPKVYVFSIFDTPGQLNCPLTWRVCFSSRESFSMADGTLLYNWYLSHLHYSLSRDEL